MLSKTPVASALAPMPSPCAERADLEASDSPGSSLRNWQKGMILFIVSWNCLVVTSSSTSLLIATPEVAATLNTSPEVLNATNSAVLLAMGCSSLFWSPLADIWSRRASYNAAISFLLVTSIGTAVATNIGVFTAMRVLSGLTGTFFMVAGQTIIADTFKPVVRGRAVGCLMVGGVAGTAIGPCIGGVIITYNTWRTIYWLQVGQAGLGLLLSVVFVPTIQSEVRQLSEKQAGSKLTRAQILQSFNPAKVFRLLLQRQVILADLVCGLLAITQYGLLSSVRQIINPRFHLDTPLISGIFYISPGVGFICGSLIGGKFSDRTVKQWIKKRNGLRLPRDRLNSGIVYMFLVLPISTVLYGWGLGKDFGGLALAISMAFLIGFGLMGAWNGLNTYTAEVYPDQRSEVVSSKYIVQYCFGATATGAVVPFVNAIGVGWAFTIYLIGGAIIIYIARLEVTAQEA